jgi:polyisoprenoid-binding protein YceI
MTSPSKNSIDLSDFAGNWELDRDRTSIEFHTKALWVIPAKGTFRALEGVGTVAADGGISGMFVIDAASVNTKNKKRDVHLRTADFFEVETFPTITFEATSGRLAGPGTMDLDGTLTVHGETRPLAVSANLSVAADSVTVSAEVDIDRSAWGLTLTPFGAGLKNRVVISAQFRKA